MAAKWRYDVVVVGAGSAGCVTASRLSSSNLKVALLEAGPSDLSFWQRLPLGVGKALQDDRRLWSDVCEPSSATDGRSIQWHSGRGIGGSSAVNGMLAVRGDPALYDRLSADGVQNWGYSDCLPFFKKIEKVGFSNSEARGQSGPIHISRVSHSPYSEAFHEAFSGLGIPSLSDYNADFQTGVYQLQLTTTRYFRSDASGYFSLPGCATNLDTFFGVEAHKLHFEGGDAVAVEAIRQGQKEMFYADRIILCLGSVRTPRLLELSGIGDPKILEKAGIKPWCPLENVGKNLRDHLMVRQTFKSKIGGTVNSFFLSNFFTADQVVRYAFGQPSLLATPSLVSTAFVGIPKSEEQIKFRIQLGLVAAEGRLSSSLKTGIDPFPGFHIGVYDISPYSVGETHICSSDSARPSKVVPRYLEDNRDRSSLANAFEYINFLTQEPCFRKIIAAKTRPNSELLTSKDLHRYFSESAHTCWHPVGTCRMGADSATSVTDSEGRVHGLKNLYIFDASIFPQHTSSNTNLPVLMAAEKLANQFLRSR